MKAMSRLQFFQATLAGIGATLFGAACGSDDDGDGGGSGGLSCSADIVSNHGHVLSVSEADVNAAQTKTYNIQGSSGHSHEVTLTAEHFMSLGEGKNVSVTSTSVAGHTHSVTVSC